MQGLIYKGLGLQSNLEEKILTTNTDIIFVVCFPATYLLFHVLHLSRAF